MKKRLLYTILLSYAIYFALSFLTVLILVPRVLKHYLYEIAEDAAYYAYLQSQAVAIQNTCYLLVFVVFLLSLIPLAVYCVKVYHPLHKIVRTVSDYVSGASVDRLNYNKSDELGQLSASLNYLISAVENSNVYQKRFISNISHDFRSPLTSIKGYIEAMLDGTIPYEMQERYLNIVLNETERLSKLTEGILLLNTFDDERMYLDLSDFSLKDVIDSTIDALESFCQKKNITINTDFPSSPVAVHADRSRIQQVLYNLMDNAIKFSSPGGKIMLRVRREKNRVFVSVKDFGAGISKENQTQIWDRFFKTDPSRGRDKKGNGLGLSIVKEIIRAHDQNINVISTEGVGTEFIFSLAPADET